MLNAANLVARSREHLTEQDEAVKFGDDRLFALIPSALAEWIKRTQNDPVKSRNFLAEIGDIAIANGEADCFAALEAKGIQSQLVASSDISIDYDELPALPVQFVASLSRLTLGGIQDRFFITAYFDGKKMIFRDPSNYSSPLGTLTGTMKIRAVSVPTSLENVPASVEGEVASILAEIARKFNTDGTHKGQQIDMRKIG